MTSETKDGSASGARDPQLVAELRELTHAYPQARGALLPILERLQDERGHLTPEDLILAGEIVDLPPAEVLSVTSFYTMFRLQQVGRRHLGICRNISCWLAGAEELCGVVKEQIGIGAGETSSDGEFSLEEVECLGSCGTAPAMEVHGRYFENLTPDLLRDLLKRLPGADLDQVHQDFLKEQKA